MVNYPHKISSQKRQAPLSQTKNFANRGMSFEKMINATNDYYLSHGLAVIHKKPTPIQIVRVDYPQRSRAKIVEAYFRQASTTDYSGVYDGYYIDFEAKETRQKHAIPMKNFHHHQIQHMEQVLAQRGSAGGNALNPSSRTETALSSWTSVVSHAKVDPVSGAEPSLRVQICHKEAHASRTRSTEPRNHAVSCRPLGPRSGLCGRFGHRPSYRRLMIRSYATRSASAPEAWTCTGAPKGSSASTATFRGLSSTLAGSPTARAGALPSRRRPSA